ncbi:MAG: hypothetical protein BRD45_01870 [Bacteroidetes bacterium QS_8_64_10]|nr:MAG: hypothetical protein BRD45_01870 [Bacteroidetes bacterium QS_8_64_10]
MTFDDITSMLQSQFGGSSRQVERDHWMFEVGTGRNRSQVIHLILKEYASSGQDVSRIVIMSPIGPRLKRYDCESLLRKNAELDTGAICLEDFRNEENDLVTYLTLRASHLVRTADQEEVWEMIETVARMADRQERDIYARDMH